jgi:NADPH:quinone reductase-like Zn-dependent oxidoreductase
VDKPAPKDNDVLISIRATSVSTGDCNVRNFTFVTKSMLPFAKLMFGIGKPWTSLKPDGVFLQNIMELTDIVRVLWTSIASRKKVKGGVAINHLKRMSFIAELATAGKLRAVIDRSYPLEQTAEAFKCLEQGHKQGNVVITVSHSYK